jgi:hypothetical protein
LAQEEFVPLRVVRLRLIEQGLLKDVPVPANPRHAAREALSNVVSIPVPPSTSATRPVLSVVPPTDDVAVAGDQHYLTLTEYLGTTGLAPDVVTQLHALGLLAPVLLSNEIAFTEFDVRIAAHAKLLLERGLDVRLLGSLRRVAEREVGLVDDLSAPLRSKASGLSGEQARDVTVELAGEVGALRSVLYERALQDYLGR